MPSTATPDAQQTRRYAPRVTTTLLNTNCQPRCLLRPIGYLYKTVATRPEFIEARGVLEIYSAADCISEAAFGFIPAWRHNDFSLFDTPEAMRSAAVELEADLSTATLFYFELFEQQFDRDSKTWSEVLLLSSLKRPLGFRLEGFDVTTHSYGNPIECSPLSCNRLVNYFQKQTNSVCLFETLNDAVRAVESPLFEQAEPGLCRIIGVHTLSK